MARVQINTYRELCDDVGPQGLYRKWSFEFTLEGELQTTISLTVQPPTDDANGIKAKKIALHRLQDFLSEAA